MKKNWLVRTVSVLLAGIMVLGLVACGGPADKESSTQKEETPAPAAAPAGGMGGMY